MRRAEVALLFVVQQRAADAEVRGGTGLKSNNPNTEGGEQTKTNKPSQIWVEMGLHKRCYIFELGFSAALPGPRRGLAVFSAKRL